MKFLIFLIFSQLTGNPENWTINQILEDAFDSTSFIAVASVSNKKMIYYNIYSYPYLIGRALKKLYFYKKGIKNWKEDEDSSPAVAALAFLGTYATFLGHIIKREEVNECGFADKFVIKVDTVLWGDIKDTLVDVRAGGKFSIDKRDDYPYFEGDTVLVGVHADVWRCKKFKEMAKKKPIEDMDFGYYRIVYMYYIYTENGRKYFRTHFSLPGYAVFRNPCSLDKTLEIMDMLKPYLNKWWGEIKKIPFDVMLKKIKNKMPQGK